MIYLQDNWKDLVDVAQHVETLANAREAPSICKKQVGFLWA